LYQGLDSAARAEKASQNAVMAAQVQGQGEAPFHVVEPVRQALGHLAPEEVVLLGPPRRPVPPAAQQAPVEDVHGFAHGRTMA
jgi:hypothetical protein